MITEFTENFKNTIKGKYDPRRANVHTELSGGAVIKMMVKLRYERMWIDNILLIV